MLTCQALFCRAGIEICKTFSRTLGNVVPPFHSRSEESALISRSFRSGALLLFAETCCGIMRYVPSLLRALAVAQNREYLVSTCERKGFHCLASLTYFVHVRRVSWRNE